MYRIGFPLWKIAAKLGAPLKMVVLVRYDTQENVYVATSNDLPGLIAEAESMDQLVSEVNSSIQELLLEELHDTASHRPVTDLRMNYA